MPSNGSASMIIKINLIMTALVTPSLHKDTRTHTHTHYFDPTHNASFKKY